MSKRTLRTIVSILILVTTLLLFIRYFQGHTEYWHQLRHVSKWTILWVFLLNCAMVVVLVGIGNSAVQLCGRKIPFKTSFILTAYSSIANFFGPLQSGPGVRAVFLKSIYKIRLRDYTVASLIGLAFFALYNALFLVIGSRPWWQTVLITSLVGAGSFYFIKLFIVRDKQRGKSNFKLRPDILARIMVLTFLQAAITVAWYYVELKAVNPHIQLGQAVSYSGAANFSLFISITPDAIGIREGFLLFSQHIHHVSTANIASANLIDRAVYVIFLAFLFIVVLAMHGKEKLQLKKLTLRQVPNDEQ